MVKYYFLHEIQVQFLQFWTISSWILFHVQMPQSKVRSVIKDSKFQLFFLFNKKFRNHFSFLICILPDCMAYDITKELWKNSHIENMTTVFLLRCKNLLRYFDAFSGMKKLIVTNINAQWKVYLLSIFHFLEKDVYVVAKKRPYMVKKWPF